MRNETTVTGWLDTVDDCMNTSLSNATFKTLDRHVTQFTQFYIQGKNIRYIQIPDDINVIKTIKWQLSLATGRRTKGTREEKKVRAEMRKQKAKESLMRRTMKMQQKLIVAETKRLEDMEIREAERLN